MMPGDFSEIADRWPLLQGATEYPEFYAVPKPYLRAEFARIERMQELVMRMASFTDPRRSEDLDDELTTFAWVINKAKELCGDLSPELDDEEAA